MQWMIIGAAVLVAIFVVPIVASKVFAALLGIFIAIVFFWREMLE